MSLPDKSTAHIPRHHSPVGAVKNGKIKVLDGETQKESWRQGKTGMSKDWDGDAISVNYNARDAKKKPHHQPHMGGKRKTHKPHMDEKKVSE